MAHDGGLSTAIEREQIQEDQTAPPWKTSFLETCLRHDILRFGSFTLKSGRVSPYFFNAGLFHRADLLRAVAVAYAETIRSFRADARPDGEEGLLFDVLFGPAYKGIPLAVATLQALAEIAPSRYGSVDYAFNRKEAKDHGEGGRIVGCPLRGKRVVVVDDVITAGTALREAVDIIRQEGGVLVGVVVALDRMEKIGTASSPGEDLVGQDTSRAGDVGHEGRATETKKQTSAIGQLRSQLNTPILSVLNLNDIICGLDKVVLPPTAAAADNEREQDDQQQQQHRANNGASTGNRIEQMRAYRTKYGVD